MGGIGSGRHSGRPALDGLLRLDVRWLHREGFLRPGTTGTLKWSCRGVETSRIQCRAEEYQIVLEYQTRGEGEAEWRPYSYPVTLEWLPCHFGGQRPLLNCPRCGGRVAVLYAAGDLFECRHCQRFSYRSQRETAAGRAQRRAEKLRRRLGWMPGILEREGGKPKGMHWRTYERLVKQHQAYAGVPLAEWDRWTSAMKRKPVV
jgi:hypothetical protein